MTARKYSARQDVATYLRDVVAILVSTRRAAADVDVIYFLAGNCRLAPEQVAPLVRLIWEVVDNALAYAHPGGARGKLRIGCREGAAGEIIIEVADDGVGLPEGFDAAVDGGAGMRLVRTLARRLGGAVSFDSAGIGLRVRVAVPKRRPEAVILGFHKAERNEDGRWRRQQEEGM